MLQQILLTESSRILQIRKGKIRIQAVGGFGAIGAFSGSRLAHGIPASNLTWMTASLMFFSALLLGMRMFIIKNRQLSETGDQPMFSRHPAVIKIALVTVPSVEALLLVV